MSSLLDFLTTQRAEFRKARLPSLYSDFRGQRTTNPDGYAANIAAWESGLVAAARAGVLSASRLTVQFGSQLERDLQTREYGLPQALGTVVEEGVIHGRMVPFSTFQTSTKSIYDQSWDLRLSQVPLKLASWVLQQTGLISKAAKDPSQRYVLLQNLEELGTSITNALVARSRRVDRAIPIEEFRKEVSETLKIDTVDETDLAILLTFLHRDKKLIAFNDKAVKVKAATESTPELTPEDVNICSLKSLISDITGQVSIINERIDQFQTKAKNAIAKKNKVSAMAALRSKKMQEDLLTKRTETLGLLEGVFAKIEEAADQVEVVKAMDSSAQVLRNLTRETGGITRVEDLLDNLHEEMAKVDEVGTLLGEQGPAGVVIDESAVDDELAQMESEAREEQQRLETEEARRQLDEANIGRVPSTIEESGQKVSEPSQRIAEAG